MPSERPKISLKPRAPGSPQRDPRRPPVRGGPAHRQQAPATGGRPPESPPQATAPTRPAGPAIRARQAPTSPPQQPQQPRPAAPAPLNRPHQSERPAHAEGARVSKLITERGLASRREADEWIEAGFVRVNGATAVLGQRASVDALIEIDPRASAEQARRVTVLLNKPVGYVSGQAEDGYEPALVLVKPANRWSEDRSGINFHAGHLRHLAPAGRLDIDSTGLLVLTQDGRIAKRLIGDETRVEKEYLVRVAYRGSGSLPEEALERLRHGLVLDDVQLRPARVSWANEDQLRFVLREGRKRQIRRMCELVGLQVLGLKRVRIGSVSLGALPPGSWRYLRDDEQF
ncbi:MAG TPA: pseudouridine synthase [Rubrivivax sp.]|nr:pseudouridine synthase [Rubrivivax sp.]